MPTKRELQAYLDDANHTIRDLNRQMQQQRAEMEQLRLQITNVMRVQDVQQNQNPPPNLVHQNPDSVPEQPPPPARQDQQVNNLGRPIKIRAFSGKERVVTPESWINFFELRTSTLTDQQRSELLAEHLEEEAQDWYMRQLTALGNNANWDVLKRNFITFFSSYVHAPGVTASRMKFKPGSDLKTYFQEKCRLLDLANTQLVDQIDFLTDGVIDDSIRKSLIVASINTLDEWLRKAKALVDNAEREKENKSRLFQKSSTPTVKPSFKPASHTESYKPYCKICKAKGESAQHWHSDCPNRAKPFVPANTPKVRHVAANKEEEKVEQVESSAPLN